MNPRPSLLIFENDTLIIKNLNNPQIITEFIRFIEEEMPTGTQRIKLDFSDINGVFPNTVVPLTGILDVLRNRGIDIELINLTDFIRTIGLNSGLPIEGLTDDMLVRTCLTKVWRFENDNDINRICDAYILKIQKEVQCESGFLKCLEWGINEVLDNAINHSGKSYGFIMGQIHPRTQNFTFCVFDSGRGFFESLSESKHAPKDAISALRLSVQEGVTSRKKEFQGNGLWGLHQIVLQNNGKLNITSSGACFNTENNQENYFTSIPVLREGSGSIIDIQLNYNKKLSLPAALGWKHNFSADFSLRIDNITDEFGNIQYKLIEKTGGYGTRKSGKAMRTEIINHYTETESNIIIDFNGVRMISSSFADELIGKLISEMGFIWYTNKIKIVGLSSDLHFIVNRSVAQRMMEQYSPGSVDEKDDPED
ncbi:MAG: STAS-like domain-containing protein [Bacteroidia bacterium]